MKSLLIICQKVDERDDLLGFFVGWIRQFSRHFERVTVVTISKGECALPANVRVFSLGKERRVSKGRQAIRLFRLLWHEVQTHDAVFAHMSPIFAIAAWPFCMFWNKKLALWYLHRSRTLRLRLALAMVDTLVTADVRSLTIKSPKIVSVGHGIDIERFSVQERKSNAGGPLHILSVGRLSPIKGFETLIHAVALFQERNRKVEVRIVGRPIMSGDVVYERGLHELVRKLRVDSIVHFVGFIPYRDMPAQYRWADIFVGCTPPGGIDKALLESMAAGCVVLTSNEVMGTHLLPHSDRLVFQYRNADDLAAKILNLSEMTSISSDMIFSVRNHHSMDETVERISKLL